MVRRESKARAIVAGVIGGLAGTLAMNYAQRAWTRVADGSPPDSAGGKHDAREWQEREEGRNSNELAAQAIMTAVRGRGLTREQLRVAAPVVHYSFGAFVGAVYGAAIRGRQDHPIEQGAAFGTAVWLLGDEVAMPLLRLSRPTTERALEKHLQSLAAHLLFGAVAESARRLVIRPRRRAGRVYSHTKRLNRA